MILFSKNIKNNIMAYQYLNSKEKNKVILKNNLIYTKEQVDLSLIQPKLVIDNIEEYIYYFINNKLLTSANIAFDKETEPMLYTKKCELDNFNFSQCNFFPKGNCVIVYFSTKYIQNPLDVLYTISKNINIEQKYFDIKIDYIPYKDKIMYYILFRYSLNIKTNLNEIFKTINDIKSISSIESNKNIFPTIQVEFEKEFFNEECTLPYSLMDFKYEGMSINTPMYYLCEDLINTEGVK